jgi:hypothetical protein
MMEHGDGLIDYRMGVVRSSWVSNAVPDIDNLW